MSAPTLYAVCHETWVAGHRMWVPGITYVHADSPGQAKYRFSNSVPLEYTLRIVSAAEPIGRWVEDKEGQKLSL